MINILCPPSTLKLGRKGENEFRTIEFDVAPWLADYPDGSISVVYMRPDGVVYPPEVTTANGVASWVITSVDTAVAGAGYAEIRLIDGDVVGKSARINTMVYLAINGTEVAPPAPDWTVIAAQIMAMIGDLDNLTTEDKSNLVAAINEAAQSGGGGGTGDHRQLTNRDANNQHPMSAITGLTAALNSKQAAGDYATSGELDALADIVDGKADAADIPSLDGYATEAYVQNYHDNTKQDVITDLASIRSGAALGATALQSVPNTYRTASAQDVIDNGKQSVISDLATIRSGAALGATAVQPEAGKGLFSGNYNDLTNKPTIPTVNDAVLTIKQGGVTKGTFSANASSATEINLDAGGGTGTLFRITVTEDNGVYTPDKTYTEALTAYNAGMLLVMRIGQVDYYIQSKYSLGLSFSAGTNLFEGDLSSKTYLFSTSGAVLSYTESGTLPSDEQISAWNAKQPTTITDTAGYFTTDTVEGALAEIGAELSGINTLIGSGVIV